MDSLKHVLKTAEAKDKTKIYSDLCWELRFQNPDSAKYFGSKAIENAKKEKDQAGLAQAYNDLSVIHILQGNFEPAIELLNEAKNLEIGLKNEVRIAAINNKLGAIYSRLGDLETSLQLTLESTKVYEQLEMPYDLAQGLNNAAQIFYELNNNKQALEYFQKSIDLKLSIGDFEGAAASMTNVANISYDARDYEKALRINRRALILLDSVDGNPGYKAGIYSSMANDYLSLEKLDSAEWAFHNALSHKRNMSDIRGIAVELNNLSKLYLKKGMLAKAKLCLDTALINAKESKTAPVLVTIYQSLSQYYLMTKNVEKTYFYSTLAYDTRDSLIGSESQQSISELQARYETEKKERQIAELNEQRAEASLVVSQQRNWIISLIAGVILLLAGSWFLIYRRRKQEQAILVVKELDFRKQLLDTTVVAEEMERQRIAKELHDGLVQSLAVLKLGIQNALNKVGLKASENPLFEEHIKQIDEAANEARNISHQMMPRALTEAGLVTAMDDMLSKTLGRSDINYNFEQYGLGEERFKQSIEIGLFRICQELVNNIIKHSGAKHVEVQLLKTKTHLVLHVEDDGGGFELQDKQKQSGIGLGNIFSRASAVNGEVNYEKGEPKGTVANVRVPL